MTSRGTVRISIRAWVNGQPIFEEELRQAAGGAMNGLLKLPEPQRSEESMKLMNAVMDRIIDQEVLYQDAVKRLKQASPNSLDKLTEFVDFEFNKTLKKMRDAGVSEREITEVEPIARRMMRRELIATEYARTLIKPMVERVGLDEIRDYYEAHKNEFLTVDRIEWQDIFIRLNANLLTAESAKHFGEDLINRCRTPDDFNQLMVYNEGPTKNSGGEGVGNLRGQIQPPELEAALFKLRQGEIGPVIPLATGVHLIRVTKREYAGQKPLDYGVQKAVRKKLENERADREYTRMVRELRARATIRLERDN
jgi:parvulin-like peptidyl-prolyl isomerase